MNDNTFLIAAKSGRKDEFYTYYDTIEKEIKNYSFKDKVIYCNCDTISSNFVKFFTENFQKLGVKKLISTGIGQDFAQITTKDGTFRENLSDDDDILGNFYPIGDFRSKSCKKYLDESDIVVSNPPFSLFREYIKLLIGNNKKFLILGNINATATKEISKLVCEKKLWLGQSIHSGDVKFRVPEDYPLKASSCGIESDGSRYIKVKSVRWFTNMDYQYLHDYKLELKYKLSDLEYRKYDNSDILSVDKTNEIPYDYDGIMGVPITFLDKYNPEQFEILGFGTNNHGVGLWVPPIIDGKNLYWRIFIKRVDK